MKTIKLPKCHILALALVPALLCAMPCVAQDAASLDEAFDLLASYEFGQSRAPLSQISAAALAAPVEASGNTPVKADFEKRFAAMLKTDITMDARRFICRELALIGTEISVPAVADMLKKPETFQLAATTLEMNPSPQAAKALMSALEGANPAQRVIIASSLGRQGSPDAVPALAGMLGASETDVAREAALALAGIGTDEACAAVADALAKADAAGRTLFTEACLTCAENAVNSGALDRARPLMDTLSGAEFPGHVRAAVMALQIKASPGKAAVLIAKAVTDPDPEIARVALGLARGIQGGEITAALTGLLDSAAPARQAAVLDVLAARGDAAGADAAAKLALAEDQAVAVAALRALGVLGGESAVQLLAERAATSRGDLRTAAQESLSLLRGAGVNNALLGLAEKGKDQGVRLQALRSLGERRAVEVSDAVFTLASDKDAEVAAEALKALRALAKTEDMPRLLGLLEKSGDDSRREEIIRTVTAVAERNPNVAARADVLIATLDKARNEAYQAALLTALGRIGNDAALGAVRGGLDRKGAVRGAAIAALAAWPNGGPVEDLLGVVKNTKDSGERASAFTGYLRLLRSVGDLSAVKLAGLYHEAAALAVDAGEKKAVLSGVANVAALEALELVDELSADPELATESVPAMLRIATAVFGADPAGVGARMEKFLTAQPAEAQAKTARELLAKIAGFGDYITAWEVAGPYFKEMTGATQLFEESLPPDTNADAVAWRVMPMGLEPERPWVVALDKHFGGEERVAYLRTRVMSPDAREVVLELGTNDGCKVWLNGAQVHAVNTGRVMTPGENKIALSLNADWNTLMVAVYQQGGAWGACARLAGPDGAALQGVRSGVRED
ncbi:MAG: HEAT repeat domain-containing protein [Candidatus Hydrogenedens sp.]|nr:HEAT repeat domain-containing protein [Candidatus Hydrogenedentota bacterium]NLF58274.1 HEAT repeat domain-containing protein [Candidatus Hydrogenedens sp.]